MVSILVVAITCIKFEFTDDTNSVVCRRVYLQDVHTNRQTDTAHVLHIYGGLLRLAPILKECVREGMVQLLFSDGF